MAAALLMFAVFAGFVPAALALLGERAWWLPSWLGWLPVLDVEGAALERPAAGARGDLVDAAR